MNLGTDYEGWVVTLKDGSILLEAAPLDPTPYSLIPEAQTLRNRAVRKEERMVMDWKDVPQEQVETLELYFARESGREQPVIRIQALPEQSGRVRFLQYKGGSVFAAVGGGGVGKTGIAWYRIGFWDPRMNYTRLWECRPNGDVEEIYPDGGKIQAGHPCWPRPHGFGLAPWLLGLTEKEIPPPPGSEP